MGSQHPSPNVKNPLRIRAENWLETITSRDAKSACFQGSQTSCTEIISGIFLAKIWPKKITSRDGCVLLTKNHRKKNNLRALSEYCFACGSRMRFHLRGYRNRTRTQSKPNSRPAQTVLGNSLNRTRSVLGQRYVSFPFPCGSEEKFVEN